jgi:3D (Asp-Asp-Asp) domain-containing protein
VKNKLLISLTIIFLIINIGTITYYENQLSIERKLVLNLENVSKTKSTKIAKLEDIIHKRDEMIQQNQKVIDNQKNEVIKLQNQVKKLQQQIANFKREKKGSDVGSRVIDVTATSYVAMCSEGCTGITATGINITSTTYYNGMRIIAVDTNVIKLYSIVEIDIDGSKFKAIALDTGGAIKGNRIDYLVGSTQEAREFGVKNAKITIIRDGK